MNGTDTAEPRRVLKSPHYWTPAEDELARTLPAREVAKATGRSYGAVKSRRQKLGINRKSGPRRNRDLQHVAWANMRHKWTPEEDQIIRDYPPHIAGPMLGISARTATRRMVEIGAGVHTFLK